MKEQGFGTIGRVVDSQTEAYRQAAIMKSAEDLICNQVMRANLRDGHTHTRHLTNQHESEAVKEGYKGEGAGAGWFDSNLCVHGSKSNSRKAASAQIAKIPFPLARWIAQCFKPEVHTSSLQEMQ